MKEIDIKTWKRRSHYELFGGYINPSFKIDVRLDMTNFMKYRPKSDGFFAPFNYLLMTAVNKFEGFRIREIDGKLVLFDTVSPSYTIFLENENFAFKATEYVESYREFVDNMKQDIENGKKLALSSEGEDLYKTNYRADFVYISCLPWLDFISTDNPLPYDNKMSMSIPRINWGKCVEENGKYSMTLSVTVNHALIDGYEASMMINTLQNMLDTCENIFVSGRDSG